LSRRFKILFKTIFGVWAKTMWEAADELIFLGLTEEMGQY